MQKKQQVKVAAVKSWQSILNKETPHLVITIGSTLQEVIKKNKKKNNKQSLYLKLY